MCTSVIHGLIIALRSDDSEPRTSDPEIINIFPVKYPLRNDAPSAFPEVSESWGLTGVELSGPSPNQMCRLPAFDTKSTELGDCRVH